MPSGIARRKPDKELWEQILIQVIALMRVKSVL
jgi:hypothetical protein